MGVVHIHVHVHVYVHVHVHKRMCVRATTHWQTSQMILNEIK